MIPRTVFANALVAALFGILVPWIKGIDFLDVFLLLAYSLLSLFFVGPLVVDAVFATEERRVPLQSLARAAIAGWLGGQAILWIGIATVSFKSGRLLTPPAPVALSLTVLSLLGCLFLAAVAAYLAKRTATAGAAKSQLRIGFLLMLVALLGVPRLASDDVNYWLLNLLTPDGLVTLTLVAAPLTALATVGVVSRIAAR